jgi:hypothetical protein
MKREKTIYDLDKADEPEHMLVFDAPAAYSVLPGREDLHTEFKEARSWLPDNLCDTLCAFLNEDNFGSQTALPGVSGWTGVGARFDRRCFRAGG